ncbi:MAG: 6-phosphogluconolactonase [Rhizobiales bacterium]|nr:6-phosphogluconolactonase [Hyphomicrobiales bacterium]
MAISPSSRGYKDVITARYEFSDREGLAVQLANDVGNALRARIATNGMAKLAVSGGTTPKLFFEKLSRLDIGWSQVTVTLVDDRQVLESSERSNARLVRSSLIQDKAAAARFAPLYNNPEAAKLEPFDAVVLGMGRDGHTASFFPGGDRLAEALDPATLQRIVEMRAPTAGEPRLTFTLPVLLAASFIALHIEGWEKRAALETALAGGPIEDMPIRAFFRAKAPITLYWSP